MNELVKNTFEDYLKSEGLSKSGIINFLQSAGHYKYYIDNPKPTTKALLFGQALHTAILEPSEFEKRYVMAPDLDRRTKIGKEKWIEFQSEHGNKIILTPDEWDQVLLSSKMAFDHPIIQNILQEGDSEVSMYWENNDVQCKGRADFLTKPNYDGDRVIIDIKSTPNASYEPFKRSIINFKYYMQAAYYMDGLEKITGKSYNFVLIAVEKTPPYACAVYYLNNDFIIRGRMIYEEVLEKYKECLNKNVWNFYPQKIEEMICPMWLGFQED